MGQTTRAIRVRETQQTYDYYQTLKTEEIYKQRKDRNLPFIRDRHKAIVELIAAFYPQSHSRRAVDEWLQSQ